MILPINDNAGIPFKYLNRHALITGQTGTGKTVTILKLAESMAQAGVPVFLSDVKGDLTALANGNDVATLDVLDGRNQIPLWATGAEFLARALDLSNAQTGVLEVAFAYADQEGLPLDSLDDLRVCLATMLENKDEIGATLGGVSRASVTIIQRGILSLINAGAGALFGPNRLDIDSLLNAGQITILDATRLYQSPRIYSMFLLWLMREFWQRLPEQGDSGCPRCALVFDESHVIFSDVSPALLRQTEQTARLIRSKGVALVWGSQSPRDLPPIIVEQCATRFEHERAQGVGVARFSTLDTNGKPTRATLQKVDIPDSGLGIPTVAPRALSHVMPIEANAGGFAALPLWLSLGVLGFVVALIVGLFMLFDPMKVLLVAAFLAWLGSQAQKT